MRKRLTITFTIIKNASGQISFTQLEDELKMAFLHRAEGMLEMEGYKRINNEYFIELLVTVEEDLLYQAIEEFKYAFRNVTKERIKHTIFEEELFE